MLWDLLGEPTKREENRELPLAPSKDVDPTAEPVEVDYEKNCTPLYGYIEAAITESDWDPIVKFLDEGYWPNGGLFQDKLTPAQQARTWVTRFDSADPTQVRWSQLPLHLAIVCGAPFSVVGRLIELYPQGVRCTDDQRNLPLHLALRHNASDDVVAYLLLQFPESVNAKGKDGRLPIQCALRAPSKVRGKILEIFVKKTKTKNKLALGEGTSVEKEISKLQTQLEAKTLALENTESKLSAMETINADFEAEMAKKEETIDELRKQLDVTIQEKTNNEAQAKIVADLALKKKIDQLEKEKRETQELLLKAREVESKLRVELESVSRRVASTTPSDLNALKKEVEDLKKQRLMETKKETQDQIDMLREELEKNMKQSVSKTDEELRSMQQTVAELRKAARDTRTNDELNSLRAEVESLRTEIKQKEEASRTKAELDELREALEDELRHADGKTKEEIATLKRAVAAMQGKDMESKTVNELVDLKKELETVKREIQQNQLVYKTQQDVEMIRIALERELREARGATLSELAKTKKALDTIQEELLNGKSSDDLLSLRKEVNELKEEVKQKEQTSKLREEMIELKHALENEIKNSEGKTRSELEYLKKALKSIDENKMEVLSFDELTAKKSDIESVKNTLEKQNKLGKAREEINELKKSVTRSSKAWSGKNKDDMSIMSEKLENMSVALNASPLEGSRAGDFKLIKAELESLKKEVKLAEEATRTKRELDALKLTLKEALKTSEGKTATELLAMKEAVDSIDVEQLEIKNKEEWDMIRAELNALKEDLKSKEAGDALLRNEIEQLKESLTGDSSVSSKKKKGWKRVFSGFRIGNKNDVSPASQSVSFEVNDAQVHYVKEAFVQDDDDVRTINPPSVNPQSVINGSDSASDSERENDKKASRRTVPATTYRPGVRSGKTMPLIPSTKNKKGDDKSVRSVESKKSYQSATKDALKKRSPLSKAVVVDPGTGEMTYRAYADREEEKKTDV